MADPGVHRWDRDRQPHEMVVVEYVERVMKRIAPILAAALLSGCATAPPASPVTVVTCLPLKSYTAIEEQALATALEALQAGDPFIQAMTDYGQMRAADRACIASQNKGPPG